VLLVLGVVARRLGEAVIEEAEAAAGDVRHEAVKDAPPLAVGVEALIKEMAQEAARLRHAEAVGSLDGGLAVRRPQRVVRCIVITEKRDKIARRRQTEPLDDRPLGFADELVKITGAETSRDSAAGLRKRAGHAVFRFWNRQSFQRPLAARDDDALVGFALAPRQDPSASPWAVGG